MDLVLDPCEDLPFVREQSARIVGSAGVRGSHVEDPDATDHIRGAAVPVRRWRSARGLVSQGDRPRQCPRGDLRTDHTPRACFLNATRAGRSAMSVRIPTCSEIDDHGRRAMRGVSVAAPKKYPDELRERAVRLYRGVGPKPVIRRLAEQLGVPHEAFRNGSARPRPTTAGATTGPPPPRPRSWACCGGRTRAAPGQRNPRGGGVLSEPLPTSYRVCSGAACARLQGAGYFAERGKRQYVSSKGILRTRSRVTRVRDHVNPVCGQQRYVGA